MDMREEESIPEEVVELSLEERVASLESVAESLIENHTRMSKHVSDVSSAIETMAMVLTAISEQLEERNDHT